MVQQEMVVHNKIGIHTRPAALLIDLASKFHSKIMITKDGRSASLESLVRLLALRVKQDNEILVSAEGEDESAALAAVLSLVESGFGEE